VLHLLPEHFVHIGNLKYYRRDGRKHSYLHALKKVQFHVSREREITDIGRGNKKPDQEDQTDLIADLDGFDPDPARDGPGQYNAKKQEDNKSNYSYPKDKNQPVVIVFQLEIKGLKKKDKKEHQQTNH